MKKIDIESTINLLLVTWQNVLNFFLIKQNRFLLYVFFLTITYSIIIYILNCIEKEGNANYEIIVITDSL